MSASIDIVLPVVAKDAHLVRVLGASLRKFWRVEGKIWVCTPDADRDAVIAAVARERLGWDVRVLSDSMLLQRRSPDRNGEPSWWTQQLIKICVGTMPGMAEHYLVLDADCFAARSIVYDDLVRDGRAKINMMTSIDPYQLDWYRASQRMLKIPGALPTKYVNVTPFVMARDPVCNLVAHLRERHGVGWCGPLLMQSGTGKQPWTEYTLYYLHGLYAGTWDAFHFESTEPLTANAVWIGSDVEKWDPAKSFDGKACFSLVQSALRLPPTWVWDRVAPFLTP